MAKNKVKYSDIFSIEQIQYYQGHIVAFVEDIIFKNDPEKFLSDQQKEFLISIQNNDRVSAKSGKGIGKSASVAYAILWFLSCFSNPKIVCTAPSFPTLNSALWPEIAKWLNGSLVKDIFEHTSNRLYLRESRSNWWAEPRTAREKENMQGLHEDNMLIIIDEASGLKQDIFDALDTTLTGKNNKLIMIGNPTQVSGPFFDSFNKFRKRWKNLTFSAENSPFVKEDQINYYADKYGVHHDNYLVNISGEFPSGSPDAFIPLTDVHKAVERNHDVQPNGEIEIGLDVARFGDDLTVLYWRHGYKVYPAKILAKNSIPEAVQLVLDTVEEIRKTTGYDKRIRVKVDDTGVGSGVTDYLKLDREHNIEVIPCNNGGKGDEHYQNEVSIMWGNFKDNLKYIGLPDESNLIEELSARRWRLSNSGKIMIEPKSEFKKEYKASPDRADALMLCFAKKQNDNIVIKDFDPLDQDIIKDSESYMGEVRYASIFYSKNLVTSIVYGAWDNNRIHIYDDFYDKESLVYVASNIHQHMPLEKITGNDEMFSIKGDDLASKFRKFGINIKESFYFNELSSIETLSNMITQRKITISKRCKNTIDQLSSWKMDKTKHNLENEYGLCYALCYMITDIRRKNSSVQVNDDIISYSSNTTKNFSSINSSQDYGWMLC